MKKIFSFVFAVALATSMWATQHVLDAGENKIESVIGTAVAGDTIILNATDTFYEWHAQTFDKKLTVMAGEGQKPVLKMNKFLITADFEINGIEITNLGTDYMIRTNGSVAGTIAVKNCYMHDSSSPFIYTSSNSVTNLIVDNCIFANNTRNEGGVIYSTGVVSNFEMRNSTVMNSSGTYAVRLTKSTNLVVDHCTFYNNGERVILIGESAAPTTCAVSNCVVSNPSLVSNYCISTYGGTVDNIVYYNTASAPRSSSSTNTNIVNADPLFVDAANGNFNFAFTSPLFLAANDGKHIGDPRWTIEATDAIAIPDTLDNTKAALSGEDMKLLDDTLFWDDLGNPGLSYASWTVDAKKAGDYDVYVYEVSKGKSHQYTMSIADKTAWLDTVGEESPNFTSKDIKLGTITIDEKGLYMLRLNNMGKWSSGKIKYVMLRYLGGGVVDVPGSIPMDEAMLEGPKIVQTDAGIAWLDQSDPTLNYATWNLNVTKAGTYIVTMTASKINSSGHSFTMEIFDSQTQKVGTTLTEAAGEITLAAGSYTARLNNGTKWSSAVLESVLFSKKGGTAMAIPGQLPGEEALLAGDMVRLENGSFQWPNKSDVASHYATWNVTVADEGEVDVYAYFGNGSGRMLTVALYDGETLLSSVSQAETTYDKGEVKLGTISIEDAGTYTIRLTNATQWSSVIVDSLVVKVAEGPIEITLDEDDTENADLTTYLDKTVNVNLVRSMPTGMFSTICLPFGASKSGHFVGAKIYYLDSTYIKGDEVILCFKENSDFYQGIPYIIEPATLVANPRFENVVIKKPTAGKTEKEHAIFQGTYFAKQLTPGDENLLYLGQDNHLYFPPSGDTGTMKGLRAYFEIKQEPGAPIRRASIKMGTDVVTTLELVGGQAIPNGKFMLNGQIVIRANGQDYMLNGMQK